MQINSQAKQTVGVDADTFGAKYSSKREVYRFLTCDCGAYLGPYETMTVPHMKELAAGKRTLLKSKDINHINIPYFDGLSVEKMLHYAKDKENVMRALPDIERERDKLQREYLGNVIYTIVGKPFQTWVDKQVASRNEKVTQKKDQIELDPEIAEIFKASQSVSVSKGISNCMMKSGAKRRRTKAEKLADETAEAERLRDIEEKVQKFAQMEQELSQLRPMKEQFEQVSNQIIPSLLANSLLKSSASGDYEQVLSWEEHQRIALQKQQDEALAQQLSQQNQQIQQSAPHIDRRRAVNQLEAIEEFVQNKDKDLISSIILVDHDNIQNLGVIGNQNEELIKQGDGTDNQMQDQSQQQEDDF